VWNVELTAKIKVVSRKTEETRGIWKAKTSDIFMQQ
jgi:hypothetical protein